MNLKWWQKAVFYQIYPRSFADGNGDGIGDLGGILGKLDYLKGLGIDAIWLSPHFPSPQIDWGYDISDYEGVAPEYGDLQQFRTLLQEAHRREIRIVLDLVLNHTSDQHAWFQESRSSLKNPKRDWYIWKPGRGSLPPNNWYSSFGGPAWELDPLTGEYYYHFFFKEQPDLNWSNPEVKLAMFQMVRYWLDMGVDGFRLDAIGTIYEDPQWTDQTCHETLDGFYRLSRLASSAEERQRADLLWEELFKYQHDYPGVHDLMRELRSIVDEYDERVLIGETDDIAFYGGGNDELHLNFNFPLMRTERMTPGHVAQNQNERLTALPRGAWPCNTLANHDSPRMFARYGDGLHDDAIARANLLLLLSLRGTPFFYNGEEIGMSDFLLERVEDFRDPLSTRAYQLEKELLGASEEEAIRYGSLNGRDKNRTPFQWSNAANGGFCPAGVGPWLPVNPNFGQGVNAAEQENNPNSMLNYYRKILALRRKLPGLIEGTYELEIETDTVLAFWRATHEQKVFVIMHMGLNTERMKLPSDFAGSCIFSSLGMDHIEDRAEIHLHPFEACWYV